MAGEIHSVSIFAEKGTKKQIIDALLEEQPLNAKQIHNFLTRKYASNSTYQATHKTLSELESEQIVKKEAGMYSINLDWVMERKKRFEEIESTLTEKRGPEKKIMTLESDSLQGSGRILLKIFAEDYDKGLFKDVYTFQNHIWWIVALQQDEYYWFKKIGKAKAKIICNSSTLFDKCMAAVYRVAGHKVKLGVNYDCPFDVVVYGNKVFQVYLPEKLKKEISRSAKGLKHSLELLKKDYQDLMYSKTDTIKILIIEDEELANKFRTEINQYFGGRK